MLIILTIKVFFNLIIYLVISKFYTCWINTNTCYTCTFYEILTLGYYMFIYVILLICEMNYYYLEFVYDKQGRAATLPGNMKKPGT